MGGGATVTLRGVVIAIVVAAAALALNMLITTVAIVAYAEVVGAGHPAAYYDQAAPRIAMWTAPVGGVMLLFVGGYVLGRKRVRRLAMLAGAVLFIAYAVLDCLTGIAMAGVSSLLDWTLFPSLVMAMCGAAAGAYVASNRAIVAS